MTFHVPCDYSMPTQPVHRLPASAVPGPALDPGVVAMALLALVPADDLIRNR